MTPNIYYYLGFSHDTGIGPMRFKHLLGIYASPKAAYEASEKDLVRHLGFMLGQSFAQFRNHFDPSRALENYHNKGIQVFTQEDSHFPQALKVLADPPICLYVKGDIDQYSFDQDVLFAVVGTRKASVYGKHVAKHFATILAAAGCVIVSGLATGIDSIGHEAALDIGGRTIAFLGCGVDIVYPYDNLGLYRRIIANGGLIISEFPPGMTVKKGLFVARNRLISGISRGVLVVEGTKRSGALITGSAAAEQGKKVYIPPLPIDSELSQGPYSLRSDGAELVASPEEILADLQLKSTLDPIPLTLPDVDGVESDIVTLLFRESLTTDELVQSLSISLLDIIGYISSLELRGIIQKTDEGKYQLRPK